MKLKVLLLKVLVLLFVGSLHAQLPQFITSDDVTVGAQRWSTYSAMLEGKAVAVVANHTSLVDSTHLVDYLLSKGVSVKKVFAPEHGFRGKASAGENVASGKDVKTGLPILSLHGSHKKPTAENLAGIDIVVFDIQDVGARFYTYISTMAYVMDACAEIGIDVLIMDRPNPNGFYVDGPMLEAEHKSFIGFLPIPVVHGMTVGELAQMINGEGWLESGLQCDLEVIRCEGYEHNMIYILPVKPSPNLPNINSILLYPSLCFFEGTTFSAGRGTEHPFEIFGHPNATVGSFAFVPKSNEGAKNPKHEGVPCIGWDLSQLGGNRIREKQSIILDWLLDAHESFPQQDKFFLSNGFFEKLAGTSDLRRQIEEGKTAEQIRASWQPELSKYKLSRKKYLLYTDFE